MTWRNTISIGFLVIAIAGGVYIYLNHSRFGTGSVLVAGTTKVTVAVASTEATREQGLSGRLNLATNEGMWFIFPESKPYVFWMKDMKFPIDIIWADQGKIVDLATDVPPPGALPPGPLPLYRPVAAANRVLEVGAGFAKQHGLKIGDSLEFQP